MAKIGYARVSGHTQKADRQVDELHAAGCTRIFTDTGSGKLAQRPELDACLAYLRPGDTLVITRLSRAMRNLREMIDLSHRLDTAGIALVVIKQAIDTNTPTGRLTFHIMAAIDEWQRELIVEGTYEGLAAARARGHVGGRKPKMSADQRRLARQLYDAKEHTVEQIAAMFGVSRHTIYRELEKEAAAS